MLNRKKIIEGLLHNMHAMRHRFMVGYAANKVLAITPAQGFVLRFVAKNDASNVKTIAETLHISSSAATQLIDGLVHNGYLIRKSNPDDRRGITLSVSAKAKKLFKEFEKQSLHKMTQLFDALTDKELAVYVGLNNKIIQHIKNK